MMAESLITAAASVLRLGEPTTTPTRLAPPLLAAMAFLIAIACLLANAPAVEAAQTNLTLICPSDGIGDPQLADPTGKSVPISDPQVKAVAAETCRAGAAGDQSTAVHIVNGRVVPIYVSFTVKITNKVHVRGPITWGAGCVALPSGGVMIPAGITCAAKVRSTGQETRFCAVLNQPAPADCFDAQANHQTMVETNFEPASNGGCFGLGNCVWYDISVIPSFCTDSLWTQNHCANTGGASYNLPVQLTCNGVPTYTCQGPGSGAYGSAQYPSNCGVPTATCNGSPQKQCKNAYFYPDPPNQPNAGCYGGKNVVFTVTFLRGS